MGAVHSTFGQIQKPTWQGPGYLNQAVRPSWIFQVWKWTGRDIRLRYEASPYDNHHDETTYIIMVEISFIPRIKDNSRPIGDVISFVDVVFGGVVRDT